jgi:regulator of protease activity HflC (stomatin/prohibitin superfamily)
LRRQLEHIWRLLQEVRRLVRTRGKLSARIALQLASLLLLVLGFVGAWLVSLVAAYPWTVLPPVFALWRALGVTIQTGQNGLLFTFGQATRVLEPGFRPLIPFLQVVRRVPTRSRTLELADQRVVTDGGLVYLVRASLVWRIVDIERALIQIDDLEDGMRQALTLSVQEVLREFDGSRLVLRPELDDELAARMETTLARWGVVVERAGFHSISPSEETLRLVQLRMGVRARSQAVEKLVAAGLSVPVASALLTTPRLPVRRQLRARERSAVARRARARRRIPFEREKLGRFERWFVERAEGLSHA